MKEIKTNHMQAVSLMPSPLYCSKGEKEVDKLMATLYECMYVCMYVCIELCIVNSTTTK